MARSPSHFSGTPISSLSIPYLHPLDRRCFWPPAPAREAARDDQAMLPVFLRQNRAFSTASRLPRWRISRQRASFQADQTKQSFYLSYTSLLIRRKPRKDKFVPGGDKFVQKLVPGRLLCDISAHCTRAHKSLLVQIMSKFNRKSACIEVELCYNIRNDAERWIERRTILWQHSKSD